MRRVRRAAMTMTAVFLLCAGIFPAAKSPAVPPAAARKIHLVVVADTLDPKIGQSVNTSLGQVQWTFQANVTPESNLLDVVILDGEQCRGDAILGKIAALNVRSDDALVVFYAGHGAYDPQIGHYLKFPRLGANGFLARSVLTQAIKSKGPRLGVLATDCCNKLSVIPRKEVPSYPSAQAPAPERILIRRLFQVLFLDNGGFVDLTSSKKGEESIGYPAVRTAQGEALYSRGGLFSSALTGVLAENRDRVLTWKDVADATTRAVGAAFRTLKPDGLDNPDEPENPQMTQTVVASLDVRLLRTSPGPGPDGRRVPAPFDLDGMHQRGALGVHGLENGGRGIAVYAVQPNSPAARLGLEQGDVILSINDNTIRTASGYAQALRNCLGAADLVFRDVRGGRVKSVTVELENRGFGSPGAMGGPPPARAAFGAFATGVAQGVRIDSTVPGSPAALSGLDPGDIVTDINGQPVRTMDQLRDAVRRSPDEMAYTLFNIRTGKLQGMVCTLDRDKVAQDGPSPGPFPGQRDWVMGILGYENDNGGLYIWATRPGTAAAKLGFEQGDLLLTLNGVKVDRVADYQRAVASSGGTLELTFRNVRGGQIQRATARLSSRDGRPPSQNGPRGSFGAYGTEIPGVGVRVDGCFAGSAAQRAGVDPGDIIVSVNDTEVRSMADYFRAVHESPDEMIFTVQNVRTGRRLGMVVSLDR
jgi:S1-C subfamily serine protease